MKHEDIVGFWYDSILILSGDFEEMNLVFGPNGRGYCAWIIKFVEIIDTFTWELNDDRLSITGVKQYIYANKTLTEVSYSSIRDKDIQISFGKGVTTGGSPIDVLKLSKPIRGYRKLEFGLSNMDIRDDLYYSFLNKFGWMED